MPTIGLVVNPVAGIGGRAGLKGSDTPLILETARKLGAVSESPRRAVEALSSLRQRIGEVEVITYPEEMGEDEAMQAGLRPKVIGRIVSGKTTAKDTQLAAVELNRLKVRLLLFVGGDGTARDILSGLVPGQKVPDIVVLGVPAGVKIHSGVFAINSVSAGYVCARYLLGELGTRDGEVMDVDEEEFRKGRVSARLYGYMKVPSEESLLQGSKVGSKYSEDEVENAEAIGRDIAERLQPKTMYVLGPGSTVQAVARMLGVEKTLLGVDVFYEGRIHAADVNERELLSILRESKAKIIVTPIGGQGHIFGRGNQQISPEVIRKAGIQNIIVVATKHKLRSLPQRRLLVDTGDQSLDGELRDYIRVVTDYREETLYRVE